MTYKARGPSPRHIDNLSCASNDFEIPISRIFLSRFTMPDHQELPKCIDLEPELNRKLLAKFTGKRTGFVQVGEKKYFFPHRYREQAEDY